MALGCTGCSLADSYFGLGALYGLGDSCYTDENGDEICTTDFSTPVSTTIQSGSLGTPLQLGTPGTGTDSWASGVGTGGTTSNTSTSNPSNQNFWNGITQAWTNAGTAIAKAAAGANPTYQSCGPSGCTMVFGSAGGNLAIPGLNTSSIASLLPILLIAGLGIAMVSALGKK